jgi:hypothetical protein
MEDRTMCRPTLEHVVEPVPARPMVHRRGASAVPTSTSTTSDVSGIKPKPWPSATTGPP